LIVVFQFNMKKYNINEIINATPSQISDLINNIDIAMQDNKITNKNAANLLLIISRKLSKR